VGRSADVPPEFAASPAVQDWIRKASADQRQALTDLLVALRTSYLPGGSLPGITPHMDPGSVPMSFNVPFKDGECLLLYQVPMRAEDPISLVLILDLA